MHIRLITVGRKLRGWVREGFDEYAKRLPAALQIEHISVAAAERGQSAAETKSIEARRIGSVVAAGAYRVALDEAGRQWSSMELSERLAEWMRNGHNLALLVGGADGLDESIRASAQEVWSLSRLTLPHAFVPILVVEQLYRGWSVLNGHPYHRE